MSSTPAKLIYVADPMCSWCWGFSPVLKQLLDSYQGKIDFELRVGGLRTGGGDPWDKNLKEFLKHHWDKVHEVSGQPFNYDLLQIENFNYDTEPACRLVVAARKWLGKGNFTWFEGLQRAFYREGKDLADLQNIKDLCRTFDMNFEDFNRHFYSEKVQAEVRADFQETRNWGIHGYPSLILHHKGHFNWISYGYDSFDNLHRRISHFLSKTL